MKTDRFTSASTRAAAALLAVLLAAGPAAAGGKIRLGRVQVSIESPSKRLAQALALQIGEVQKRFGENRRALRPVRGADGKPAYLRQEVAALITRTWEDLDKALERVEPSALEPLSAWAAEELGRLQGELAAPVRKTAASPSSLFTPRAVAVVAGFKVLTAAAPREETVPAETSNRLLDQVREVIGRIFFLADRDDLEVKLWVGSTPAPQATFGFWAQGKVKGATPARLIIRTNGKRDSVVRGLYAYQAAFGRGPVKQLVEYPVPAGAPAAQLPSERLDLVNGSRFFCCRFNEQYCHHVGDEKECRP